MEEFHNFIEQTWGRLPQCATCGKAEPAYLCGACMETAYCGKACQRYECIGTKREQQDGEKKQKKELVSWEELRQGEVWRRILPFLKGNDVKNVLASSRWLYHLLRTRRERFQNLRVRVTSGMFQDADFLKLLPFIQAILIEENNLNVLSNLKRHPHNVQDIVFGRFFNQDVRGALPASLTHRTFGSDFNQDVRGALPANLTHLTFGDDYPKQYRDGLPAFTEFTD